MTILHLQIDIINFIFQGTVKARSEFALVQAVILKNLEKCVPFKDLLLEYLFDLNRKCDLLEALDQTLQFFTLLL